MIIKTPDDATKNALLEALNKAYAELTSSGRVSVMVSDFLPYIADWNNTARNDIKAIIGDAGVVLDINDMNGVDKAGLLSTLSTVIHDLDTAATTAGGYQPDAAQVVKFYSAVSKGASISKVALMSEVKG